MDIKKIKIGLFIILIIILILIMLYNTFGLSFSLLSVKEIKKSRELNEYLTDTLKINETEAIYDINSKTYFYTIPKEYENKNYILKLHLDDGYKYKILNNNLNIIKVNYDTPIDIIIYNDKYYYQAQIQLTNLPLITINTEEDISREDTKSTFKYINPNVLNKIVSSNSKIHVRGSSSSVLSKKSYKINMYNQKYSKEKDVSLSDLYYGSSFILDAVYRDKSKIRNVLATEMWNEISNDFSEVDIKSEFVELFINQEYSGLYILTEPINRKKLNLDKSSDSDTSTILKMINWINMDSDSSFEDISDYSYSGYEIKYPNEKEMYQVSWEKLLSKVSKYYDKNVKNTDEIIKNTFNLNNYIDIIIFNSFISNVDNCLTYNNYLYTKNLSGEVFIQPWDMEYTYGFYPYDSENVSLKPDEMSCEFKQKYASNTNKLLINRYKELRKDVLTHANIDNLLDNYENILTKGSAKRDIDMWYEEKYDIEKEIEQIRIWLYKRLEYFDKYVSDLEHE